MINLSFFLILLGINQGFYFLKFGLFFLIGLFNFRILSKELNILFILIIIFGVLLQNSHSAFFQFNIRNFHAYPLFEMIIFPFMLSQFSYNLTLTKNFNIILVSKIFVILTLIFIVLQSFFPQLGYFLYKHNILEYPRLYKEIARTGYQGIAAQPGISSSEFYMSAYMSMLVPLSFGKKIKPFLIISYRYLLTFMSVVISIISTSRGLLLALLLGLSRSKIYVSIIIIIPGLIVFFLQGIEYFKSLDLVYYTSGDFERYTYFYEGIKLFLNNPLGESNLNTFGDLYETWPHNFIIIFLLVYGIDFLIVLIYFYFILKKLSIYIILAILGGFMSAIFHNMSPFFLNWPFWVILGYGLAERNLINAKNSSYN